MLEGTYSPPFYTDLYNFRDGAQEDIFVDSYSSIPVPSVNQTVVPTPLSVFSTTTTSLASGPTSTPTATNTPIPPASSSDKGIWSAFHVPLSLLVLTPFCFSKVQLIAQNPSLKRRSTFASTLLRYKKRTNFSLWHMF